MYPAIRASTTPARTVAVPAAALVVLIGLVVGSQAAGFVGALVGVVIGTGAVVLLAAQLRCWSWTDDRDPAWLPVLAAGVASVVIVTIMRDAGESLEAYAEGALTRPLRFFTNTVDADAFADGVDQVERYARDNDTTSAEHLVWRFVVVDSVLFIAAYVAGARRLIAWRAAGRRAVEIATFSGRLLQAGFVALMALAVVDWLENLGLGAAFSLVSATDEVGVTGHLLLWATSALFYVKWSLVAVVVAALATELVVAGWHRLTR